MAEFIPFYSPTPDWLDVTFSPNDSPDELLRDFIQAHGLVGESSPTPPNESFRFMSLNDPLTAEYGSLHVSTKYGAYRVSASGAFLASLRFRGLFAQYLTLLASCPYRVTRLDAALDVPSDAASILADLDQLYPYSITLNRQRPLRTKMITERRADGLRSGTWYAGHMTRSRVTARVYDKSLEVLTRSGVDLGRPYTRYELTFREGTANLNDAYDCSGIFWAHIGSLLPLPQPCPEWMSSDVPAWVSERVEVLPHEALLRRVSNSAELDVMIALAQRCGPEWQNHFMHILAKKIGLDIRGHHLGKLSA